MNTKTFYLNTVAAALLLGAGTVHAQSVPLADAIHLQMQDASARIQADIGATVKAQPLVLDVPGVEIGEIELVDTARPERARSGALLDASSARDQHALRRDLINKALEVPGLYGLYRYMAASAYTVAIVVAD